MTRIAVMYDQEGTRVLTDKPGVPVLIVDRNIREAENTILVDGERAVVRAVFGGIPRLNPEQVHQIFDQLQGLLPALNTSQSPSQPRTVVLIERGAAPEVLTEDDSLQAAVVQREMAFGADAVTVLGVPAAADAVRGGVPQVAPRYVASVFEQVGAQLDRVFEVPILSDKRRMQLINVARAWFGVELL